MTVLIRVLGAPELLQGARGTRRLRSSLTAARLLLLQVQLRQQCLHLKKLLATRW